VTIRSQNSDPGSCRIVLSGPSPQYRFATVSSSISSFELEGVTIENGYHTLGSEGGGTIRVLGTATLRNCVVDNSQAHDGGAFMVEEGGELTLVGCRIQSCWSKTGGAGVVRGTLHADSTLFWANSGYESGFAGAYAGGLYVVNEAYLDRCTFVANTGQRWLHASAIYAEDGAKVEIDRSIIAFGKSGVAAVGGCTGSGWVTASCTDVFGNGQNWAACLEGQGNDSLNITLEPGFCDALAGNFHSDSVYICCGDCGQIGAYDSVCVAPGKMAGRATPATFLGIVGRHPASAPVLRFGVGPEARGARVDVTVYDVAGRRVRRLYDGIGGDLPHMVVWDGSGDAGQRVASGVYFARLTVVGGSTKAQRVVILR
jgi:hypothetical protein